MDEGNTLWNAISKYSVDRKERLFAFFYKEGSKSWSEFKVVEEFRRQELPLDGYEVVENWNGSVCSSYGSQFVVRSSRHLA